MYASYSSLRVTVSHTLMIRTEYVSSYSYFLFKKGKVAGEISLTFLAFSHISFYLFNFN